MSETPQPAPQGRDAPGAPQGPPSGTPAAPGRQRHPSPGQRPGARPPRSAGRTVMVTCLTLVGAVVLVMALVAVLLYVHFSTPEHEGRILDRPGGYELVADPCATLHEALPEDIDIAEFQDEWSGEGVVCTSTLSDGEATHKVEVRYMVKHQPLLFGRDRQQILESVYGGRSESAEIPIDDRTFTHWRAIDGVGDHAKQYLVWEHSGPDSWTQTSGALYSVAKVRVQNAVITAQVEADLPLVDSADAGEMLESELQDALATEFAPPTDTMVEKALGGLE